MIRTRWTAGRSTLRGPELLLQGHRSRADSRTLLIPWRKLHAHGDHTLAEQNLRKALELEPTYEEAMYNLAELLRESAPDEAVALYRKGLEIDPTTLRRIAASRVSFTIRSSSKRRRIMRGEHLNSRQTTGAPIPFWAEYSKTKIQSSTRGVGTRCRIGDGFV